MKDTIKIYTNLKNTNFIEQILTNYNLNFDTIKNFKSNMKDYDLGIVLIDEVNYNDNIGKAVDYISKNYLLITNSKDFQKNNKIEAEIITSANSPNYIRNKVEKFLLNKKIIYKNLSISDKKLTNLKNEIFCYLTDVEKEILVYLIKNNNCTKEHIKNNILKIKSNIETNSLDSHLFRIRKKFDEIGANLLIQSKQNQINIFSNQKN